MSGTSNKTLGAVLLGVLLAATKVADELLVAVVRSYEDLSTVIGVVSSADEYFELAAYLVILLFLLNIVRHYCLRTVGSEE